MTASAVQYKNFIIIICHEDFGLCSEWHLFATNHGMGPADDYEGDVKKAGCRDKSTENVQ
jgi:hypothetical protein